MLSLIRVLSLIGLWLSCLSLYEYLTVKAGVAGLSICNIGQSFDCASVARSEWSVLLGLPLASWGIVFYFSVFLFCLLALRNSFIRRETVSAVCVLLYFLASIFSIFLFSVSFFSIGKLCTFCIGMYLVNFFSLAAAVLYARPDSFIYSITNGSLALLAIPRSIIGLRTSAKNAALCRLGALVVIFTVFATTVAEDYITDRFIRPHVFSNLVIEKWKSQTPEQIEITTGSLINADFSSGNPDALIKIVEFSDFQCPGCRRLHVALKPLLEIYKEQIYFVLKNFPLDHYCNDMIPQKFHEHACFLASYARCAGEQNKYWEIVDFINQSEELEREVVSREEVISELDKASMIIGLDQTAAMECVSSERHLARIKKDISEAQKLGIDGTPRVWVNGRKFQFERFDDFKALFQELSDSVKK